MDASNAEIVFEQRALFVTFTESLNGFMVIEWIGVLALIVLGILILVMTLGQADKSKGLRLAKLALGLGFVMLALGAMGWVHEQISYHHTYVEKGGMPDPNELTEAVFAGYWSLYLGLAGAAIGLLIFTLSDWLLARRTAPTN